MTLTSRWTWPALLALLGLVWAVAYALPRSRSLALLEQQTAGFERDRSALALALEGYAGAPSPAPLPTPNPSAWVSEKALNGLEEHLDSNTPYGEGKGTQVRLRALKADQVSDFLTRLTQVNLIVKTMKLEDRDGDGRWNLEMMVEVPS